MWKVKVLGSSSSGNCIFVSDGYTNLLLDAGLTIEQTKNRLKEVGEDIYNIQGALITHEHGDHMQCAEQLADKYNIPIAVSKGVDDILSKNIYIRHLVHYAERNFNYMGINIIPIKVVHDAVDPLAYLLVNSKNEKLLYITDTGTVDHITVKDVDIIIIEANYDEGLLNQNLADNKLILSRYERTMSVKGHLSIEQTIGFLKQNVSTRTKHIILSHLSNLNGCKNSFKYQTIKALQFENIHIAEKGLCVEIGYEANPY
jgi:phosphoribosyl 1,2-cyclic phosphodiesterase